MVLRYPSAHLPMAFAVGSFALQLLHIMECVEEDRA